MPPPGTPTAVTTSPGNQGEALTYRDNSTTYSAPLLLHDNLGKLVKAACHRLAEAGSLTELLRRSICGGDLQPHVKNLPHPAASLLDAIVRYGVQARVSTPAWGPQRRRDIADRGAHPSSAEHLEFLREEFTDYARKRFWLVLPLARVMGVTELRLSPLGVVPQAQRRPRPICDHSFYGINQDTLPDAPEHAMQFGHTIWRLMYIIARANPAFGPVLLAKFDLADGYYRVPLAARTALLLATLLPVWEGEEPLVGIPLALTMGWTASPPYFCAVTETIADLVNHHLRNYPTDALRPHRLEAEAEATRASDTWTRRQQEEPFPAEPWEHPVAHLDVYIDDFIGAMQTPRIAVRDFLRLIFHNIDAVFRPLTPKCSPHRTEPISLKKLRKGDGLFTTRKEILGWCLDTCRGTIELTEKKERQLRDILEEFPRSRKRVSTKRWQEVIGELRSMSPAVAGSRGLFGPLQEGLLATTTRIHLSIGIHDCLDDFRWLLANLEGRPTRIAELIPSEPRCIGATDAAGHGMGGIFFIPTGEATPAQPTYHACVWREPLPSTVQSKLTTFDNPSGTITNSDLELAATIAHHDVVAHYTAMREATIATLHDNTPALFWQRKGSATTKGPAAYLLRLQTLHQRHYRYVATHDFIPGVLNAMADEASRLTHLSDASFLAHFNARYPQQSSWNLCQLQRATVSSLISALSRRRCDPEVWTHEAPPQTNIGNCGWNSVPRTPWNPSFPPDKTPSRTSPFSQPGTEMDESHPPDNPFDLAQLRTHYATWARRMPYWDTETYDWTNSENSTSVSNDSSASGGKKTNHPTESSQYPSNWSQRHYESPTTPQHLQAHQERWPTCSASPSSSYCGQANTP